MQCPNCHSHLVEAAQQVQQPAGAKQDKRTDTEAQLRRIVDALRAGPKTTDQLRALGIYQTSARIHYLRKQGYVIETALFDGYAADGYSHARMARYTLREEPAPEHPAGAGGAEDAVCS